MRLTLESEVLDASCDQAMSQRMDCFHHCRHTVNVQVVTDT